MLEWTQNYYVIAPVTIVLFTQVSLKNKKKRLFFSNFFEAPCALWLTVIVLFEIIIALSKK